MVMPHGNMAWQCKNCGWKKEQYCRSDVIIGPPQECPECQHTNFKFIKMPKSASMFEILKNLVNKK